MTLHPAHVPWKQLNLPICKIVNINIMTIMKVDYADEYGLLLLLQMSLRQVLSLHVSCVCVVCIHRCRCNYTSLILQILSSNDIAFSFFIKTNRHLDRIEFSLTQHNLTFSICVLQIHVLRINIFFRCFVNKVCT